MIESDWSINKGGYSGFFLYACPFVRLNLISFWFWQVLIHQQWRNCDVRFSKFNLLSQFCQMCMNFVIIFHKGEFLHAIKRNYEVICQKYDTIFEVIKFHVRHNFFKEIWWMNVKTKTGFSEGSWFA